MAGKKNSRSSKTDHVLNLLAHPAQESPAPSSASPAAAPSPAPDDVEAPAVPESRTQEPAAQGHHLSPPILQVARASNEALEEAIHDALADALEAQLEETDTQAEASEPPEFEISEGPAEFEVSEAPAEGAEGAPPPSEHAPAEPEHPVPDASPEPSEAEDFSPAPADVEVPPPETVQLPSEPQERGPSIPQPGDDEPYIQLPDGSRFVNVMMILVEEKLERYVHMFQLCDCPRCLADAKALALSRLPAKYVVLPDNSYPPMMNLYRAKFDSTVTAQIIYACKQILDAPRH